MTLDQLKAFLEKVKGDSNLQDKLKVEKTSEDVIGIAKEHGHEFSAEHLSRLSEEELESMSGGVNTPNLCCCTAGTFKAGYSGL